MSISESVYVAFFLMVIVFIVLFFLYVSIRLFSAAIIKLEDTRKRKAQPADKP